MRADQIEDEFDQDPMLESAENFMDESEVGDDLDDRDMMERNQNIVTTQGYQKEGGQSDAERKLEMDENENNADLGELKDKMNRLK